MTKSKKKTIREKDKINLDKKILEPFFFESRCQNYTLHSNDASEAIRSQLSPLL